MMQITFHQAITEKQKQTINQFNQNKSHQAPQSLINNSLKSTIRFHQFYISNPTNQIIASARITAVKYLPLIQQILKQKITKSELDSTMILSHIIIDHDSEIIGLFPQLINNLLRWCSQQTDYKTWMTETIKPLEKLYQLIGGKKILEYRGKKEKQNQLYVIMKGDISQTLWLTSNHNTIKAA